MNIINNYGLSDEQLNLLNQSSTKSFKLENFNSLDEILTSLDVDVHIERGQINREIPEGLNEAENYWSEEANRIERQIPEDRSKMDDYQEARRKLEKIRSERELWPQMKVRGFYDPNANIIKLFPDAMHTEYQGTKMDELLVSTLAHETMHAYFNRPGHENIPYNVLIEEPLAEFGMLLFLHETRFNNYYKWAHQDVSSKRTCYKYGAMLIDKYLSEGPRSATRAYLEAYKIRLDGYPMPTIANNGHDISLPDNGEVLINGRIIKPQWQNLINLPTYFYDNTTRTLGLNGDWALVDNNLLHIMDERFHHHMFFHIENLYLEKDFYIDDDHDSHYILHLFHLNLGHCNITISSSNKYYKITNGIAMTRHDYVMPIYKSCGKGYYAIPQNGKLGLFNKKGQNITTCKYDSIWSFNDNGLCQVSIYNGNHLYGFINEQGQEQIPVMYDDLHNFHNGRTIAKLNGNYYIIDEQNNQIADLSNIGTWKNIRGFNNDSGIAPAQDQSGKWGGIDIHGHLVVPCECDDSIYINKIYNNVNNAYNNAEHKTKD